MEKTNITVPLDTATSVAQSADSFPDIQEGKDIRKDGPEAIKETDAPSDSGPLEQAVDSDKIKAQVEQAIMSSKDTFVALENVGSMYCIPSHNIINDNSLSTIKVVGDTITAPAKPVTPNNMKAILQAIGSVLDHISQRIDQKLEDKTATENFNRLMPDDPSLGTIIQRDVDDDGHPITVYDSGVINHAKTPGSTKKAAEIRASLSLKYPEERFASTQYFGDEADISKGTNLDAIKQDQDYSDPDKQTNDIAASIQEESFHMDHIARFGDTRYLGFDLLQEQGFGFIKRTDHPEFIQEEFKEDHNKPKKRKNSKGKKPITADDIKYLKFDNKKLIQAIKFFNAAYMEQNPAKNKDFKMADFMNSSNYQKGLDAINAQLNCRCIIRFFDGGPQYGDSYSTICTPMALDLKTKLTISKSKGFQLGGMPIEVRIVNKAITQYPATTKNPEFFGQTLVAIILHEIFHNISLIWRIEAGEFNVALGTTIGIASSLVSTKDKRILFTNFVETFDRFKGLKLNKFTKQLAIKQLLVMAESERNAKMAKAIEDKIAEEQKKETNASANKSVSNTIVHYKKALKKLKGSYGVGRAILLAIPTLGMSFVMWRIMNNEMKNYQSAKKFEEYYCDLFAGMYNIPVVFFIGAGKYVANEIDNDLLKELYQLDVEIDKYIQAVHPTTLARVSASVTIAKNMLATKTKLSPEIKKYLQWIVDNFSSLDDINIDEIYNTTTFDPKTAHDLDNHIKNLIDKNQITLTEAFFDI